jgi:hypothetical protein
MNTDKLVLFLEQTSTLGSAVISLAYGIPFEGSARLTDSAPKDLDNPRSLGSLVALAEAAVATLNAAYASGAVVVDLIPATKHFPSWLPGLGFKEKLPEWKNLATEFRERPFEVGRALIVSYFAGIAFVI